MNVKQQRGVGMIEVLVTVLVLAIGLLGLASLQVASMKNTNNAHYRALATIYAYDMAERMRSNPKGVAAGNYNNVTANKNGGVAGCTGCIASQDATEWSQALVAGFPEGVAGRVTASGNNHEVTITWNELEAAGDAQVASSDFTLTVQIFAP